MASIGLYPSRLGGEHREIRLLRLQPGTWTSEIACTMITASLNHQLVYSALSYVWGDQKITSDIHIDGHVVSVTQNLQTALRHIRSEEHDLILWVDAVCINQKDIDERNQQVSIMGEIYTAASTVLIWIGEADDLSNLAFDSMEEIAQGNASDPVQREVCSFYLGLSNRPWFGRVWIIQELALATSDPTVFCGRKSASWSVFIAAWTKLSRQLFEEIGMVRSKPSNEDGSIEPPEVLARIKIDLLNSIRTSFNNTNRNGDTFRNLYISSRTSESTDPRDRIYGLLGMLRPADRAKLTIDYSNLISKVFTEAMSLIFENGEGPDFLSGMWLHAGTSSSSSSVPDLPTWVPDFSAQTAEKAMRAWSVGFRPPSPMTASGAGAGADNGRVCEDGRTLRVEVLPVGKVERTLEFGATVEECVRRLEGVEGLVARAREAAEGGARKGFEKFGCREEIWRVLVAGGKYGSGYDRAPDSYGGAYACLLGRGDGEPMEVGEDVVKEYRNCLGNHLPGRTFFTTEDGLYGIGAPGILVGDLVSIWFGAPTTFVTRSCRGSDEGKFTLIGAAYVGGIMGGEMVDELYCEDLADSQTLYVV